MLDKRIGAIPLPPRPRRPQAPRRGRSPRSGTRRRPRARSSTSPTSTTPRRPVTHAPHRRHRPTRLRAGRRVDVAGPTRTPRRSTRPASRACRSQREPAAPCSPTAWSWSDRRCGAQRLPARTLRVGDDPEVIGEALAEVENRLAPLLRHDTMAVPRRAQRQQDRRRRDAQRPQHSCERGARGAHPPDVPDRRRRAHIHFPTGPGTLTTSLASTRRPPSRRRRRHRPVRDQPPTKPSSCWTRLEPVAPKIRTYRNAVAFLVADDDAKDAMRDRVRADLAASAIVNDGDPHRAAFRPKCRSA